MRFTYDKKADALAIELTRDGRTATMKKIAPGINADFDAEGRLITIEILNASAHYPPETLKRLDSPVHWLTLGEAAKESGLTASTLRNQVLNGKIEATKQGRDWMVTRHELMNYLENRSAAGRPAEKRRARKLRGVPYV